MSFSLSRPPQNEDELYWMVRAMWGVTIPRNSVCPDHVAPFDVFADAYFNRNGTISLWHGSRGLSGKSFMLSILGLTKAFVRGADVNLLGGSLAQSANIHEHMRMALEYKDAPYDMVTIDTQTLLKLTNRARIRPLTASQKTVRGPHPPFLLLDEIDEMDINILDAALGQPMPQTNWLGERLSPYTVLCSTWQNAEGTFTEIKRRFEERDLPIKTWCYRESANEIDGWLDQETIEAKKREIPAEMWRVEYELGEPSIGNRAFDTEAVDRMFSLPFTPLASYNRKDKEHEEYRFEEPRREHVYVAGADWAKEQDYTVISVWRIDQDTHQAILVHYVRIHRRPWPMMVGILNRLMREYNCNAEHDALGVGNMVNDYLDDRARGFFLSGDQRYQMLSGYVSWVENDRYRSPMITSAYLAHKYARTGDLFSGKTKDFHLPDEVCSFAMAHWLHKGFSAPQDLPSIPKDNDWNRYERMFNNPDREEKEGQVQKMTSNEPSSISLII